MRSRRRDRRWLTSTGQRRRESVGSGGAEFLWRERSTSVIIERDTCAHVYTPQKAVARRTCALSAYPLLIKCTRPTPPLFIVTSATQFVIAGG